MHPPCDAHCPGWAARDRRTRHRPLRRPRNGVVVDAAARARQRSRGPRGRRPVRDRGPHAGAYPPTRRRPRRAPAALHIRRAGSWTVSPSLGAAREPRPGRDRADRAGAAAGDRGAADRDARWLTSAHPEAVDTTGEARALPAPWERREPSPELRRRGTRVPLPRASHPCARLSR